MAKLMSRKFRLGQGMTEYIIIVALIAIAAIVVFEYFGQTVRQQAAGLATEVSGQSATAREQGAKAAANSAQTQGATHKGLASYDGAGSGSGN